MITEKIIEFRFDFAGTYSYPAAMRIEDLATKSGGRIVWRPFVGKEAKSRLRANTERAMALGIFGAPSFIATVELFWGHDRLETARAWQSQD